MNTDQRIQNLRQIADFQKKIAEDWHSRGRTADDPFAKFLFYFAGLNSLYFLHRLGSDQRSSELEDLHALIRALDPQRVERILREAATQEQFFAQRLILRMDQRTIDRVDGTEGDGRRDQETLRNPTALALQRLTAIGSILYRVRCNLIHGSKQHHGIDAEIVGNSILPLDSMLRESLEQAR